MRMARSLPLDLVVPSLVAASMLASGCGPAAESAADLEAPAAQEASARTALDAYVASPDPASE